MPREWVTVLCGELITERKPRDAVRLGVDAPEGTPEHVNLRIDHITRKMVSEIPARFVDLLEIAAYVYAADQLVTRGGRKMRGMGAEWRRDLHFKIPVRDLACWEGREIKARLINALGFLSDDYYSFEFCTATKPRPANRYLSLESDGVPAGFVPDRIVLLSGGLDSLAGVAAGLIQRGDRLALVSHHASTAIQSRQTELVEALRSRAPETGLFHVSVRVTRGLEEPREFTQRTRSFLFAALAFVVARMFRRSEITFFENGIVSVNLPISEHVLGSRATRTTHPKSLSAFGDLFGVVAGTSFRVWNPYFWQTKAEVLRKLADAGCAALIARTFSCSHVRLAVSKGQQCGTCTQCIDRRFAVLAAGLERFDPQDGYVVDLLTGPRERPEDVTVAESYVLAASRHAESTETAFFSRHGELMRVIPYLAGEANENATKIYELHRRHGEAVRRVVDRALAETNLESIRKLPATSLLALLRGSFGSPGQVRRDPTETEPPAAEQATAMIGPVPVARPIHIQADSAAGQIVLSGGVVLRGVAFKVINELLVEFADDHRFGRRADDFRYVRTPALCKRLRVESEILRQRILRIRREAAQLFRSRLNAVIQSDDIIQNQGDGRGYRLNPHLSLYAGSSEKAA